MPYKNPAFLNQIKVLLEKYGYSKVSRPFPLWHRAYFANRLQHCLSIGNIVHRFLPKNVFGKFRGNYFRNTHSST